MRSLGLCSLAQVESIMQRASDADFEFVTLLDKDGVPQEGVLGYGHMVLIAPPNTGKTIWWNFEITEVYLNEWSSGHEVRRFHKIPKRLQKEIDRAHNVGMGVP